MKPSKTVDKRVSARRTTDADAEVGRRVRARRLEMGLSQTELADAVGVTFQQVQKYEKGVNRIGAGRLQRISEALKSPMSFFFDTIKHQPAAGPAPSFALLQTSGATRLLLAYAHIRSRRAKALLVEQAETLVALEGDAHQQDVA